MIFRQQLTTRTNTDQTKASLSPDDLQHRRSRPPDPVGALPLLLILGRYPFHHHRRLLNLGVEVTPQRGSQHALDLTVDGYTVPAHHLQQRVDLPQCLLLGKEEVVDAVAGTVEHSFAHGQGGSVENDFLAEGGVDRQQLMVGGHVHLLFELLLHQRLKNRHFVLITVHENHLIRVDISQQIDDSLGIGVGTERYVFDLHLNLVGLPVDEHLLGAAQQPIAQSTLHAVPRNYQSIALVPAPFLEHLDACTRVQHARGGKQNVGSFSTNQTLVEGFYFFELEDVVPVQKLLLDFFVLPVRKQSVKQVSLLYQSGREIHRHVAVSSFPVGLKQHCQFLSPAEGKNRNEHFTTAVDCLGDQLQHRSLPVSFGVSDGRRVGGLRQQYIRSQSWSRGCSQVPIRVGIVVACVDCRQSLVLHMVHAGSQDVSGIIRRYFNSVDCDGLHQPYALHPPRTIFDLFHSKRIKLLFFFGITHNLPVIFQHNRQQSFGGRRCEYGSFIAVLFCEVGQGAAVVEVEVGDDDEVERVVDGGGRGVEEVEIGVAAVVGVEHVDAHVEHDCLVVEGDANAGTADLLTGAQAKYLDLGA